MTTLNLSPAGAARRALRTTTLLACGAIAGPLFTAAWAVEGATRANYDPLRHPVSSLELGDAGWTQQANFVVAGLLTLAFAIGLRRALRPLGGSTWGPLLVGAHAIGLLGAGIFVTDPVSGYPPGTPGHLQTYGSVHAALHDLFSVGTFVGLPIACLVFARRFAGWGQRGWAIYSAATGAVFVVGFVLTNLAFNQVEGLVELGGLFQRSTVTVGWSWLTLLAIHLLAGRSATSPGVDMKEPRVRGHRHPEPGVGGVPPLAAVLPAGLAAVLLTVVTVTGAAGWSGEFEVAGSPSGAAAGLMTAAYLPLLAWGPLLGVTTLAYWLRRRRRSFATRVRG